MTLPSVMCEGDHASRGCALGGIGRIVDRGRPSGARRQAQKLAPGLGSVVTTSSAPAAQRPVRVWPVPAAPSIRRRSGHLGKRCGAASRDDAPARSPPGADEDRRWIHRHDRRNLSETRRGRRGLTA